MDRRHYVSILIILILAMIIGIGIYSQNFVPASTPKLLYDSEFYPAEIVNTTQGATIEVNFTLTSMCSARMAVPIELKLLGYDSTIEGFDTLETFGFGGGFDFWNTSVVQDRIFNYSLSFSKVTLESWLSNSTIITINLADDAPVGRYLVFLYLDRIEFLSPPGMYEVSYSSDTEFGVIVTSNNGPNVTVSGKASSASLTIGQSVIAGIQFTDTQTGTKTSFDFPLAYPLKYTETSWWGAYSVKLLNGHTYAVTISYYWGFGLPNQFQTDNIGNFTVSAPEGETTISHSFPGTF